MRIWHPAKFERTAESRNYPNFSVNQSGHEIAVLFSVMDSQRRIPDTDQPIQLPCAVHSSITKFTHLNSHLKQQLFCNPFQRTLISNFFYRFHRQNISFSNLISVQIILNFSQFITFFHRCFYLRVNDYLPFYGI